MTNVEKAQRRVDALREEQTTLQRAVSDLQGRYDTVDRSLDDLYAAEERQPSPAATQAVAKAESEKESIAGQQRRKKAALAAVETDLAAANAALQLAQRAQTLDQVQAIYQECIDLASKLDKNIDQPSLWAKLAELSATGNQLWLVNLAQRQGGHVRGIFEDPRQLVGEVFSARMSAATHAMGVRNGAYKGEPPTVADALQLGHVLGNIRYLQNGVGTAT